ncbi:MAG TPA: hypothetical protein VNK43_11090 [Gemmatimonadales bacterium]|nr:hypothetical protein [Gemmatimonadales bacterium]
MFRSLIGFSILAVVGILALKFFFMLLGITLGLVGALIRLAIIGLIIYFLIKLISPDTARGIKETITGKPAV